jgi:hypothetical protein
MKTNAANISPYNSLTLRFNCLIEKKEGGRRGRVISDYHH